MYWNARKAALSTETPRQSPAAGEPTCFTGAAIPLDAATRRLSIGSLAPGNIVWRGLAPGSPRARNPQRRHAELGGKLKPSVQFSAAERERGRRGNDTERQRPCLLDPRAGRGATNNRCLKLAFLPLFPTPPNRRKHRLHSQPLLGMSRRMTHLSIVRTAPLASRPNQRSTGQTLKEDSSFPNPYSTSR